MVKNRAVFVGFRASLSAYTSQSADKTFVWKTKVFRAFSTANNIFVRLVLRSHSLPFAVAATLE